MPEIHQEVTLRWHKKDSLFLVQAIADFCAQSDDYDYLQDKSMEYERNINADACIILAKYAEPFPILSFATGNGASLQVTNVVPATVSEIDIATYNQFIMHFVSRFKAFSQETFSPPVRVECTSSKLTLESIIPGKKTRDFFLRYLNMHPTSHHPSDIERLDMFICAASAYCRRHINTHRLHRYLIEVLKWSEQHATWCTDRIETGLDVLDARKRF